MNVHTIFHASIHSHHPPSIPHSRIERKTHCHHQHIIIRRPQNCSLDANASGIGTGRECEVFRTRVFRTTRFDRLSAILYAVDRILRRYFVFDVCMLRMIVVVVRNTNFRKTLVPRYESLMGKTVECKWTNHRTKSPENEWVTARWLAGWRRDEYEYD